MSDTLRLTQCDASASHGSDCAASSYEHTLNCECTVVAASTCPDLTTPLRDCTTLNKRGTTGPLHRSPPDLRNAIGSEGTTRAVWKDLTPLARNEWICWVISAKLPTTRRSRIRRAVEDLKSGKRRPCCWPGCPHRRPAARKWFERRASQSQRATRRASIGKGSRG